MKISYVATIQIFLHHSALQLFESCFIRYADTLLTGLNNTLDCDKEKHEDTKVVIRNRISKKDRQYIGQKKEDRQYNGQKKKDRQYNDQKKKDRQYNGQKKKDRQYNGQKKKDRQYNGQTKEDRQYNGQTKKDKQPSKKHYTESKRSDNTNPTKNRGLRNGRQFLLYLCHPSCHSCYKPDNKSCMRRKGHNYGLSKPMNTKTSRKTRFLYKTEIVSNCCLSSINVRENRRDSQEWTIQRHWQSINVREN